jgi:hypothetical protein
VKKGGAGNDGEQSCQRMIGGQPPRIILVRKRTFQQQIPLVFGIAKPVGEKTAMRFLPSSLAR